MQYRDTIIRDRDLAIEAEKGEFIMVVTEKICEIMEENNISRQSLAEKMGKSKGFVSQVLNGSRNMTLNTLAEISHFLEHKINISFEKKQTGNVFLATNIPAIDQTTECEYRIAINE